MDLPKSTTLICTLGGQPQVVTFALDALLAQGVPISELIVLHFSPPDDRLHRSLAKLQGEFTNHRYGGQAIPLRLQPLRAPNQIIRDIYDESDANAAWEAINQLVVELKNERRTLHVGISGGRRILGLLTMSAAMLHFGHQDVLWHMYTPRELRLAADEGAMMHLPPGSEFRLIQVPMMPWGSYFPALRQLMMPQTAVAGDVLAQPRQLMDEAERKRCTAVVHQLTDRQKEVLRAFANGLTPQEVAARLHITIKTVDSHKTVILAECRNAWNLPEDTHLDYRFLAEKFSLFWEEKNAPA